MGRHARPRMEDPATVGLKVAGGVGLYPKPGEQPEDRAKWLDMSWALFRGLAMDDRLYGLSPYDAEIGSKPAIDPHTGTRRGRRRHAV